MAIGMTIRAKLVREITAPSRISVTIPTAAPRHHPPTARAGLDGPHPQADTTVTPSARTVGTPGPPAPHHFRIGVDLSGDHRRQRPAVMVLALCLGDGALQRAEVKEIYPGVLPMRLRQLRCVNVRQANAIGVLPVDESERVAVVDDSYDSGNLRCKDEARAEDEVQADKDAQHLAAEYPRDLNLCAHAG